MVVDLATAGQCLAHVIVSEQQRRLHCMRHGNSAFIYGDRLEDPRDASDLCGLDALAYASETDRLAPAVHSGPNPLHAATLST